MTNNHTAPTAPPFASEIEGRRPRFKTHSSIGPAKLAVGLPWVGRGVRGGKIYQWSGTEWELLFDVPAGLHGDSVPWRREAAAKERAAKEKKIEDERLDEIKKLDTIIHNWGKTEGLAEYLHNIGYGERGKK